MKNKAPNTMKSKLFSAAALTTIVATSVVALSGCQANNNQNSLAETQSSSTPTEVTTNDPNFSMKPIDYQPTDKTGHNLTKDSKNAKVTITEFTDFQCPACARMEPIVDNLVKKYDGTDVQICIRNFPLPMHKNAPISAQAAEAASKQNKYKEYVSKLYTTQNNWGTKSPEEAFSDFKKIAEELKLNIGTFESDYNSDAIKNIIKSDEDEAKKIGVKYTPTMLVGDKIVETQDQADSLTQADYEDRIQKYIDAQVKAQKQNK